MNCFIFLGYIHVNKLLFVKFNFHTLSYFTCNLNWIHQAFICELTRCDALKITNIRHVMLCLFVCFVALRPKSTAMVIAGRSVHLTTLFPGQA